jgi:hypothetical protein
VRVAIGSSIVCGNAGEGFRPLDLRLRASCETLAPLGAGLVAYSLNLLALLISVSTPIVIFLARNWFKARIEKGVQHHFDVQIEDVRTELRKSEERFKSELRDNEAEIATLRNTVLAGSASRQALLDKRRFEAVEKVWTAVNDLAQLKYISSTMAILNFKAIAKEATDPRTQRFLSIIGAGAPGLDKIKNVARDERPFLPELAWAYFNAYTTILYASLGRYKVLSAGVDEPEKYLSFDALQKILKAALPHHTNWIDENDPGAYHYLLDEIESNILTELRKILEGKEADQATAARAKDIMGAVKAANEEQAEAISKQAADL